MVILKKFETQKVKVLFFLCGFLFFIIFPISNFISSQDYSFDYSKNTDRGSSLNTSGSWMNTSLTIDATASSNSTHYGNWKWAVDQPWCSGLGTYQIPYIIENLSLSIGSAEYGLSIQNSRDVYFKLINVSAHGATDEDEKGLYITNSTNGLMQKCNFTANFYGIYMYYDCDNFTLVENDVSRCTSVSASPIYKPRGIFLEDDCDFNTIVNNTANQDGSRMDDGIYLINQCSNNTILNNTIIGNDVHGIHLRDLCNNNTILDNTVEGHSYGIYLYDTCLNNHIENNSLYQNSYGVYLYSDTADNVVYNNNITSSSNQGVYLHDSYNNTISHNQIVVNGFYGIYMQFSSNDNQILYNNVSAATQHGIFIADSLRAVVSGNNLTLCGLYVRGSEDEVTSHIVSPDNTANGKPIYYYINQEGLNSGDFFNAGQIILANCSKSTISSFNLYNVSLGIGLLYVNDSLVSNNIIFDCLLAFYLEGGYNNTIRNNDFSNNVAGIDLESSDFNYIYENTVNLNNNYGIWLGLYSNNNSVYDNSGVNNGVGGIYITFSYNNTFYDNSFNGSSRGIELSSADQNYILYNRIWTVQYGFLLQPGCEYNVFKGNNITGAFNSGFQVISSSYNEFYNNIIMSSSGTGFYITNSNSENNSISHNAFLTNNIQGQDLGNNTKWTQNSIGNYWDDYTGNDTNSDGIGDTPYLINPNGIDDRPLMYYPYISVPPTFPDLVFQSYTLDSDSLTLVILNNGTETASSIELVVRINSLSLTLFNDTITPLNLGIDDTTLIVINLTNFFDWFEDGVFYSINAQIDPLNYIEEVSEDNNLLDVNYTYHEEEPELNLPPAIPWTLEYLYFISLASIVILIVRIKKHKFYDL